MRTKRTKDMIMTNRNFGFCTFLLAMLLLFGCSEDDGGSPKGGGLTANAGPDQTVAPFTTVTLDGSASTGLDNSSPYYTWSSNGGPVVVSLNNANSANPTFEPTKNGQYQFLLRLTQGSEFSEDVVTIIVTGAIELSGTLIANTTLLDIELDPSLPDYIITGDLTIPSGVTLDTDNSSSQGITVMVADNAGIIVQEGGRFQMIGSLDKLTANTGWKGILVSGGTIEIENITIEKAGTSAFAGQAEPAAITIGSSSIIESMSQVKFQNSGSYDLLIAGPISTNTQDGVISGNTFSNAVPIKAPISFVSKVSFNNYPASYDYLQFVPSGGSTIDVASGSAGFTFPISTISYMDGDFLSDSPITIQNATVLMKEGAGILSQKGFVLTGSTIKGVNDTSWKGIAFASSSDQMVISASTIENAGSDVFSTGFFSTSEKAAIYFSFGQNSNFASSTILGSGGYGIFNDDPSAQITIQSSTFSGTTLAALRLRVDRIPSISTGNTFTMSSSVAAVEVFVPNLTTSPSSTWNSLGGSNYYLMSNNVRQSGGSWTLQPGVNLKFKSGKFMEIEQGSFTAIGTAIDPITFDGEAGTVGTWAGIHAQSVSRFEFCQIKNGGEVTILINGVMPATEKANVVFNYGGASTSSTFKNNTVSGSGGYGVLVEAGKQDPDALNAANNNTFSANTSGDVIVK